MKHPRKRIRAPGAGRKPKGRFAGNTVRFNMRCTPVIKKALEIAAKKSGRSLPQEIQERIEFSFWLDRKDELRREEPLWDFE